jgi:hypothetical protein
MPWKVIKRDCKKADGTSGSYVVLKEKGSGSTEQSSCHDTKEKAQGSVAARKMSEARKMRITKRQLRKLIRETMDRQYLLSEKNWEKEAAKLDDEDEEQADEIRTIGDLKNLIKQAKAKKRGDQTKENIKGAIKDAIVDEILGKIPFAGTAKTLFDFVKSSYDLPDESRTGTALDHLDVDDDVAKIVDDPIENAFLEAFGEKLDGMSDDQALEDLNMTKNLSDYLEGEFNSRTVAGFSEGKKNMRITKSQLKRIIREQVEEEIEPAPPEEAGPNPVVQTVLDQMEDMSIDDLRIIWRAVADVTKRKRNELKAGFKKGDKVAWTNNKTGEEETGTVARKGGKYVMVIPDGDTRKWKKWPDSLRKA